MWQIYRTFADIIDNRHKKATRMKITEVLERYGMTLREVARAIGMKPSTLQTTIDGNPTIGTLRKIAEAAKCPLAEFFADELAAAGLEIVKKGAGPAPSPAPTGVGSLGAEEQPSAGGQQASDGERPDLITIDPVTGESRKYKLIG